MSLAQSLLLNVPPVFLGIVMVVGTVLLSIIGLLIVRCFISHEKLKIHNDVAGFMFSTLGVIYAVLLAFTVIIVWESYDKADANVEKEANCLADLYRDSAAFHEPVKSEIQALLGEYVYAVIDDEWKTIERGEISLKVQGIINKLWDTYANFESKAQTEQTFFEESVGKLNELGELRRMRLMESRNGINPILWFVLIVGGVITIVFTFFFGMANVKAQIAMTTLLAALISLILSTILEFDYPFTGSASIKPEPFEQIVKMAKHV